MALGYNRVILIGNMTADPEVRKLQSGTSLAKFGIAVNRQYRSRESGEMVGDTCFIDVEVWGALAERIAERGAKGASIMVEGRLRYDTWVDSTGKRRSRHSVVAEKAILLSFQQPGTRPDSTLADEMAEKAAKNQRPPKEEGEIEVPEEANLEDDLPF